MRSDCECALRVCIASVHCECALYIPRAEGGARRSPRLAGLTILPSPFRSRTNHRPFSTLNRSHHA